MFMRSKMSNHTLADSKTRVVENSDNLRAADAEATRHDHPCRQFPSAITAITITETQSEPTTTDSPRRPEETDGHKERGIPAVIDVDPEVVTMPHPQSMPATGFQALILCGPGVSLNTFTSNPAEFPKALIPVANRPMVWYPLDWCYRLGVTAIHLITPPSAAPALSSALSTDPHLTSLPVPRPSILAPEGLTQNTGTAELFRLPEVRAIVAGDFIVLPCDLISELGGEGLLESWVILQAGLGGVTDGRGIRNSSRKSINGERGGRRGGIGVWYETRGEGSVKGQETDFIATVALLPRPIPPPPGSVMANLSQLVMAMPTDTLKDKIEKKGTFSIRKSLLQKHPRVRMLMTQRDAHIYFFPYWVLDMMRYEKLDSISEDVIGWWAKSTWQDGLGDKLGLREVLEGPARSMPEDSTASDVYREEEIDLASLSSTKVSRLQISTPRKDQTTALFASRVGDSEVAKETPSKLVVPNVLAYVHPFNESAPLIRRVDTTALLLAVSLYLAKLESVEDVGPAASPLAHSSKIAYPAGVAQKTTITKSDCLLADNVTVDERAVIKQTVIGANCKIEKGVRLTRCLLMDGVVIGERCQLDGCIIGRRSRIGKGSVLRDCEVQDGFIVPDGAEAKNENFMVFEGLDDEDDVGIELGGNGDDD
ncbi:hypothetical protein FGG08_003607 [Glutinoglossum americanum]|uniref:Translation initiation factor eIF2B subunit gamma n=1 Tax=Glutinoglossum americanum TaxID=1670608 RepID=A0A9P8L3C8_9PEZI|nr:hypothetical protein FGG08_003607 [Glutinoglossum americanum]